MHPLHSLPLVLLGVGLSSCGPDILFATHTSSGLDLSGDIAKVPDHVSLGFRRREIAYVGKQVPKSASVLGRLDSQTTWGGGIAIRETFATGPAASAISANKALKDDTSIPTIKDHPVTFASRTRVGFSFSVGGSDDDSVPSLHFGYTRRIATHMTVDPASTAANIPSVVADTTVHGSGIAGIATAPDTSGIDKEATLSGGTTEQPNPQGGIRIRQLFAVGKGATSLLRDKVISEKIKTAITQSPQGNTTATSLEPQHP